MYIQDQALYTTAIFLSLLDKKDTDVSSNDLYTELQRIGKNWNLEKLSPKVFKMIISHLLMRGVIKRFGSNCIGLTESGIKAAEELADVCQKNMIN